MNTRLAVFMLIVALAFANGCETTAQAKAKQDLENSKAAYERCLQQNLGDPSKCEIFKRLYEADLEVYREAGKSTGPTFTGFFEVGPGDSRK
ncbi:MAG: hypothetical protein PHU44_02075 [Syntrophales bacterium]|nr:hypothetical protein [Syntrophales bacterium]MDD5640766.1 hypothetical protein [Syntrophales bacterium]